MTNEATDAAIRAGWVRDGIFDGAFRAPVIDCERSAYATGRASGTVPREPTREMMRAGVAQSVTYHTLAPMYSEEIANFWRAMWDAAPLDLSPASVQGEPVALDWNAMARVMQRIGARGTEEEVEATLRLWAYPPARGAVTDAETIATIDGIHNVLSEIGRAAPAAELAQQTPMVDAGSAADRDDSQKQDDWNDCPLCRRAECVCGKPNPAAPDPLKCPGDGCKGCTHCRASNYPPFAPENAK